MALGIAPDEPDQVLRLGRFREEHPDVIIGDGGFGTWQARIPELDGETIITRYILRELLDKLDELTTGHDARPGSAPDRERHAMTALPGNLATGRDRTSCRHDCSTGESTGSRGIRHCAPVVPPWRPVAFHTSFRRRPER
jgi:hypothetical protein